MEQLEILIQELYKEGTREKNMKVLSHIRKLGKDKAQFIIPVGSVDDKIAYRRLSLDDGSDVFVAFTTQKMANFGEATQTINEDVLEVLNRVLNAQDVTGIVLNPWKDSYYLPKVLIEMILDDKNLESEIKVVKGDITTFDGDCIVNAANSSLLGGGGVDGAIHRAAGPQLLEECKLLNGCQTGQSKITQGYNLKAKYVIHTVGPVYSGKHEDEHMLRDCYWNSLNLARQYDIHSIAFPAISCGVYGYPVEKAVPLVLKTVADWLDANSDYTMKISLYCFDEKTSNEYQKYTTYQGE